LTVRPFVRQVLNDMYALTGSVGTINDLGAANSLQYVYQSAARVDQYAPTIRVDFNLSDRHRLSGTYWLQRFKSDPDILNNRDPRFPGLPNSATQTSWRNTGSATLRSTLGANLVNELRGGLQTSPSKFSTVTADQFENQAGWGISFPANTWTDPTHTISPAPRNTTTWSVENTLNWLRGSHSISVGGSYAGLLNRLDTSTVVTNVVLGFDTTNDPAAGMFGPANFTGASAAQLTEARNLYAILTGRVSSIPASARLNAETGQYVYNGLLSRKSRQTRLGAYIQDSWRVSPTFTLNAGVRWDAHLPFTPVTATYSRSTLMDLCGLSGLGTGPGGRGCNMFAPGVLTGQPTTYTLFQPGDSAYNANWTDFAPNVGVAWRPDVQDGFLRLLLGDPEQATIRAGYSISFNQERIDRFENNASDNPGGILNVPRNNTTGFPLVLPGESHPVLFSQTSRLGPPSFPTEPVYPLTATTADNVNIFPDELRTPRVHSYSVGMQRSLGADMAVEVRYVGNQNKYIWAEENWNERNIHTNGFLEEFRLAQQNLRAHVNAGCGTAGQPPCTFAYRGPGTGTSPLPIHLGRERREPTCH
jgi:TonB dependent receptor